MSGKFKKYRNKETGKIVVIVAETTSGEKVVIAEEGKSFPVSTIGAKRFFYEYQPINEGENEY